MTSFDTSSPSESAPRPPSSTKTQARCSHCPSTLTRPRSIRPPVHSSPAPPLSTPATPLALRHSSPELRTGSRYCMPVAMVTMATGLVSSARKSG